MTGPVRKRLPLAPDSPASAEDNTGDDGGEADEADAAPGDNVVTLDAFRRK